MQRFIILVVFCLNGILCSGQNCDSLDLLNIASHPFYDSVILVEVENRSFNFFSGPNFLLFNGNGDTVAKEIPNFFGISGKSQHHLKLLNSDSLNFQGHLQLYTYNDSLTCEYFTPVSLCPTDSCHRLAIGVVNFGGSLADGEVIWSLFDSDLNKLQTSTLVLNDTLQQEDSDTICLAPGTYRLEYSASASLGGQVYSTAVELASDQVLNEPLASFASIIEMELFIPCAEAPNAVVEAKVTNATLRAWFSQGELKLESSDEIGKIKLLDLSGRLVYIDHLQQNTASLQLQLKPGIYLLQKIDGNSTLKISISR